MKEKYRDNIQFSNFTKIEGDVIVASAILYFQIGDDKSKHFGHRQSVSVPYDATEETKTKALEDARQYIIDNFDIIKSAKNQGHDLTEMQLQFVKLIPIPTLHNNIAEAVSAPIYDVTKVDPTEEKK